MWINPLDKLPQIPQDYANHILYAAIGVVLMLVVFPHPIVLVSAMSTIGVVKKLFDYFKEGESWQMCVGKSIATAFGSVLPFISFYFV